MVCRFRTKIIFCLLSFVGVLHAQEYRSIDGVGNNGSHPEWGSAKGPIVNHYPVAYADGISQPTRMNLMNPREISNALFQQDTDVFDEIGLNDFAWGFGQFVDHDITLVDNFPAQMWQTESVFIKVPDTDTMMEPGKFIPVMRSLAREGSGTDVNNPRRYANEITAFVDASSVYGSEEGRASWLRTFQGGKLKTSKGNLLPWNTVTGEFADPVDPDAPYMADDVGQSTKLFVAGDVRANENPMLSTFHLLFVREHNRLCDMFLAQDKDLNPNNPADDEYIYQRARKVVGAILQHIVFDEWLPVLGVQLEEYGGYDSEVNPSISNAFSAASFRWGHTMINNSVMRVDLNGDMASSGNISLSEAFFNPLEVLRQRPEVYIKGMGIQVQQNLDCKLVNSIRNFLFKNNPVFGGLDLAAINVQRGRERGLLDYNAIRAHLGLTPKNAFEEICVDTNVTSVLKKIYGDVSNIDPWIGMLAEDPIEGSIFGELLHREIYDQFLSIRDGDRFYYLNDAGMLDEDMFIVNATTMSELILRNTDIECFQQEAFRAASHDDIPCFPYVSPSDMRLSIAPNPVEDFTFLSIYSAKATSGIVRVVNEMGQEMMSYEIQLVKGENNLRVDFAPLVYPGPYYLLVEREDDLGSVKLLKL